MIYKQSLHWNFLPKECASKFPFFIKYCTMTLKKYWGAVRSITMPPIFHIAHLARYTPKFSGGTQKWIWCQRFCVQSHVTQICATKKGNFGLFFHENNFPGQTINFRLMTFPESYDLKGSFEVFWTPLSASCVPSDFSLGCGIDLTPSSETLSYVRFGQTDNIK